MGQEGGAKESGRCGGPPGFPSAAQGTLNPQTMEAVATQWIFRIAPGRTGATSDTAHVFFGSRMVSCSARARDVSGRESFQR